MFLFQEQEDLSHARTQRREDALCFALLYVYARSCRIAAISILTLCAGCGSGRCPIGGDVTFDGKPVQQGSITLEPVDGQGPTTGGTIADGKYSLIGDAAPLPGKKTVRIVAAHKTGRQVAAGPPSPPGTMVDEIIRYIPPAYNRESTLKCDVSSKGPKEIDFDPKSK